MRSPPRARNGSGLTLVELLVSVSIATSVCVLATVSFVQIQRLQARLQTRLGMHQSARFVYQHLAEDLTAFEQDAAYWVETTADSGAGNGTVSITFLRAKLDEHDFCTGSQRWWPGESDAIYQTRCTDLTWCCWSWNQAAQTLSTGVCSPPRTFKILTPFTGPNGNYGSGGTWFVNMPQPLRQFMPYPGATPAGSSQAALSGNRYGSTDYKNDLSDYADLWQNMSPIARDIIGMHLELQLCDGSVVDADNTSTQTLGYDGDFISGQCAPGADGISPYYKRPRLLRVLLDMKEPQSGVVQSFSFSFRIANFLPKSYATGKPIP